MKNGASYIDIKVKFEAVLVLVVYFILRELTKYIPLVEKYFNLICIVGLVGLIAYMYFTIKVLSDVL